jgi:hypothetical protein
MIFYSQLRYIHYNRRQPTFREISKTYRTIQLIVSVKSIPRCSTEFEYAIYIHIRNRIDILMRPRVIERSLCH